MNKKALIDPGQHWHKDNLGDEDYDYVEIPGIDYPAYDEHSDNKTPLHDINWESVRDDATTQSWDEDTEVPF